MSAKRRVSFPGRGSLIMLALVLAAPAFAQGLEQKVKELEKKITLLEQRIVKLEEIILQLPKVQAKPVAASLNRWKEKASWRSLRKGMDKSEVERLLGEAPKIVTNTHYGDIWYYPDLQGGFVSFDKEGILTSWNEI